MRPRSPGRGASGDARSAVSGRNRVVYVRGPGTRGTTLPGLCPLLAAALALLLTGALSATSRAAAGWPASAAASIPGREAIGATACTGSTRAACVRGGRAPDRSPALAMAHLQPALTGEGSITGQVSDAATKAPLEGIEVCAESAESQEPEFFDRRCRGTEKGGVYTIEDLEPGASVVSFAAPNEGENFAPQYWNGHASAAEADSVMVDEGTITEGIDAALTPGAEITGLVESKEAHAPLEARVCAFPIDDLNPTNPDGGQCADTDPQGRYTITSLPPGEFALDLAPAPPYASEWLGGATEIGAADTVRTRAGLAVSAPAAAVARGATISGRVVDAATRAPIEEAEVCVDVPEIVVAPPCASSDGDGEYSLTGVPAGSYPVGAETQTRSYLPQVYSGASELRGANFVTVSSGDERADIDFALTTGARLTGRVTSAASKLGVKEVDVCAEDPEQERFIGPECATTNGNGEYEVQHLAPGEYVVSFETNNTEYARQVYSGKTLFDEGNEVSVTGTGTYTHVDAELQLGGKISGTVTAAGQPAEAVEACALSVDDGQFLGCDRTSAAGTYTIRDLPSGLYKVDFGESFDRPNLAPQFFADKAQYDEADTVSVVAGTVTTEVNAAMSPGGRIEGTILDSADGLPVQGAAACLYEFGDFDCATTRANGSYTLAGLGAATADRIEFVSGVFLETPFADQFYNGGATSAEATPVGVAPGGTTDGIDAGLALTASPVAEGLPFIWGSALVGQTLGDGPAEWLNAPTAYGYQWLRCDAAGAACAAIAGATARRYTVTNADAGQTLRIEETASSEYGQGVPAVSGQTRVVPGAPPQSEPEPQQPQEQKQEKQAQPGGSGVLSASASSPSVSQILAALLGALRPNGTAGRIANVRKHGRYALSFNAPAAGRVSITWFLVPKGGHVSGANKHPRPEVVASGAAVATHAGKLAVTVKLNAKGRSLLAHSRRLNLIAKGSFEIKGRAAVSATETFALH